MSFWMCKDCRKMVDNPAEECSCGCTEASDELIEMDMYEAWYCREKQKTDWYRAGFKAMRKRIEELEKLLGEK